MKTTVVVSSLAFALTLAGLASLQAAQPPAPDGYAEGIYREFAAASAQRVQFELKVLQTGSLSDLHGKSFGQLTGLPHYRVATDEDRFALRNGHFNDQVAKIDRNEFDGGVEGFDVVGLPAHLGTYRKLSVSVSIDGKTRHHQALEFCWQTLNHCVVYDPSVEFIDSIVNNARLAKAAGYGPRVQMETAPARVTASSSLAACGLASNPAYISKWLTWAAWTQRYKNVYGMTLVTKNLGGQQSGIRCNSSCQPAPFGYSNSSSGSGTLGYDVDCGNAYNYGTSGRTGRWVAETKCAHKFTGSAEANVTRSGSGSGVSLSWNTNGGIDSNGGYFTDTCGYF